MTGFANSDISGNRSPNFSKVQSCSYDCGDVRREEIEAADKQVSSFGQRASFVLYLFLRPKVPCSETLYSRE